MEVQTSEDSRNSPEQVRHDSGTVSHLLLGVLSQHYKVFDTCIGLGPVPLRLPVPLSLYLIIVDRRTTKYPCVEIDKELQFS